MLELAYDDPTGVTAAFNKNLLARINRELGGDFDVSAFSFFARYDERDGVVRSYLRADRDLTVRVPGAGIEVAFEAGETIHTESSYKFTREEMVALPRTVWFRRAAHRQRRRPALRALALRADLTPQRVDLFQHLLARVPGERAGRRPLARRGRDGRRPTPRPRGRRHRALRPVGVRRRRSSQASASASSASSSAIRSPAATSPGAAISVR